MKFKTIYKNLIQINQIKQILSAGKILQILWKFPLFKNRKKSS